MIRELIDMELDAVAGGTDVNALIGSIGSTLVSVSRTGNTQLNNQPQTATANSLFGVANAQNFGGTQINSIG
jgi:hypothetical protein